MLISTVRRPALGLGAGFLLHALEILAGIDTIQDLLKTFVRLNLTLKLICAWNDPVPFGLGLDSTQPSEPS